MVPRGCAILYVPLWNQHLIRTTFPTSWGYERPVTRARMKTSHYFVRLFEKVSTIGNTQYICVLAALKFREEVCGGEAKIRSCCKRLAREGGRRIAEIIGTEVLENESKTVQRCCFINVRLPLKLSDLGISEYEGGKVAKWTQEKTPADYETYIPTKFYAGVFGLGLVVRSI